MIKELRVKEGDRLATGRCSNPAIPRREQNMTCCGSNFSCRAATEERLLLACSAAYRRLKGACKCLGQSHAALALMSKADPKSPDNDLDLPMSSSGRSEVDLDQPL